MKKIIFLAITALLLTACDSSQKKQNKKHAFSHEVLLKYTPVKNQGNGSNCWAYAMAATIETEHLMMGDSINLSVQYITRKLLELKTKEYFLSDGTTKINLRATAPYFLKLMTHFGIMPFDSYYSQDIPNYKATIRKLKKAGKQSNKLSSVDKLSNEILDEELGVLPKSVFMLGMEYTTNEFARSVCQCNEYEWATSFTHHPFYSRFVLEIPDNKEMFDYLNIPLDSMMNLITKSLESGHPVCWEGDISEKGFDFKEGVAVLSPEKPCTQSERQRAFELRETTDDHSMELIGIARDTKGQKYFIAKNSWGTNNPYRGLMYLSENYVRMKTMFVVFPKIVLKE